MSEPFVEPFEVCECVPEFLTTDGIGEKEGATLSFVLQDESSHHFLFVQRKIFSHIQIISRDAGRVDRLLFPNACLIERIEWDHFDEPKFAVRFDGNASPGKQ